ncbi:hypothetical protein JHK85_023318 [Glycine max]|nr:hypothetical protein JHK87_022730 [Glycine soja]KAG5017182.1 hypothetical protein JHK85_023318 [Glycine max]KAG5026939.1 hypothetical protein JHK86_022853 [Glycine max]
MAGNMAVIEHSNNKNPARLHREQWEICFGSLHPLFFILNARLTQLIFLWQIQKFAMRFPSIYEAESFINALKEILKGDKDPEPLNTDFGSEILSQSEFMSTIGGMGGYN